MSDPFWTFSLAFYRRPGVEAACLALQDEAGADVNLVLYLLWCAATGRSPATAATIAEADRRIEPWRRAVVIPLRTMRRAMKADLLPGLATEDHRTRVKALELDAERLAQAALFAMAGPPGPSCDPALAAEQALSLYAAHLGRPLPERAVRALLAALA